MQAKNNKNFVSFANPKGLKFSFKLNRGKVGWWVSLPLEMYTNKEVLACLVPT